MSSTQARCLTDIQKDENGDLRETRRAKRRKQPFSLKPLRDLVHRFAGRTILSSKHAKRRQPSTCPKLSRQNAFAKGVRNIIYLYIRH
jgi:hypothetical protein